DIKCSYYIILSSSRGLSMETCAPGSVEAGGTLAEHAPPALEAQGLFPRKSAGRGARHAAARDLSQAEPRAHQRLPALLPPMLRGLSCPPERGRSPRGWATLTLRVRPSIWAPLRAAMASSPP